MKKRMKGIGVVALLFAAIYVVASILGARREGYVTDVRNVMNVREVARLYFEHEGVMVTDVYFAHESSNKLVGFVKMKIADLDREMVVNCTSTNVIEGGAILQCSPAGFASKVEKRSLFANSPPPVKKPLSSLSDPQ